MDWPFIMGRTRLSGSICYCHLYFSHIAICIKISGFHTSKLPGISGNTVILYNDNISFFEVLLRFGPFLSGLKRLQVALFPMLPEFISKLLYPTPTFLRVHISSLKISRKWKDDWAFHHKEMIWRENTKWIWICQIICSKWWAFNNSLCFSHEGP